MLKMQSYQKIAIFRALQIGDMLCALPAMRAIRQAYPAAQITLIGLPWAKDFVTRFSTYINSFIAFPGYAGLPEQEYDQSAFAPFLKKVKNECFDLLVQMQGDGTIVNDLLMRFGAKTLAGSYSFNVASYPDYPTFVLYRDDISEIERNIHIAQALQITPAGKYLEFPVSDKEREAFFAQAYLKGLVVDMPYVCMHVGARDPERRWNAAYFAFVADALIARGYQVVFTGVKEEQDLVAHVIHQMQYQPINFSGTVSLGATAALLQYSKLVITNCTAISHIADALNVPSIVIYLTSDPNRWAPLNSHLHQQISPDEAQFPIVVLEKAIFQLEGRLLMSNQKGGAYGIL